jgi:hypothetical protein
LLYTAKEKGGTPLKALNTLFNRAEYTITRERVFLHVSMA